MNINIDTSNIDLVHNPDILTLVLKSLPKAHIVHVENYRPWDRRPCLRPTIHVPVERQHQGRFLAGAG